MKGLVPAQRGAGRGGGGIFIFPFLPAGCVLSPLADTTWDWSSELEETSGANPFLLSPKRKLVQGLQSSQAQLSGLYAVVPEATWSSQGEEHRWNRI